MTNGNFWMQRLLLGLVSLLATFLADAGDVTVGISSVSSRQRYPWNGLVDIDCEVTCSDPNSDLVLSLKATDNMAGNKLAIHHVWLDGDSTHTNSLIVKAGRHRLIWDADADARGIVSTNVTINVQAQVKEQRHDGTDTYLVIDLSGGTKVANYPWGISASCRKEDGLIRTNRRNLFCGASNPVHS